MRVAITGASGYVGGLLAEKHAERGDEVRGLVRGAVPERAGVRYFQGDLAQARTIPRKFFEGADVLYHCAAELESTALMDAVNVGGTRALLSIAGGSVGRWVQLSTAGVYGDQRSGTITEDAPIRPATAYAKTKSGADRLVQENGAIRFTILRPVAVIGPRMVNRSIYAWLDAIDRGLFFFIGAPGALVNYVHEKNVVNALMRCASRPEAHNRIYNLSQDCAIERFVGLLAASIGRPTPRRRLPQALARATATAGSLVPRFPLSAARVDALTRRVEYPTRRIEAELDYGHAASIDDAVRDMAAVWKTERAR